MGYNKYMAFYLILFQASKTLHMIASKRYRFNFLFLILAGLWSCGPTIHYLGDSFSPTTDVKEYFDEKGITSPYRVIGTMTNEKFINHDVKYIREQMIKKAQEVGADAILYFPVEVDYDHEEGDKTAVKAKLLKFE